MSLTKSCFALSITMAQHFPRFIIILFSLKQFKSTSHSDSRNAISFKINFTKQGQELPSAKLCTVANNKRSHQKTI